MNSSKSQSEVSKDQAEGGWKCPPGARGTAAMDPETQRRVASLGGRKISSNIQHMAEIGRKGGKAISVNKSHMAAIGAIGGRNRRKGRGEE